MIYLQNLFQLTLLVKILKTMMSATRFLVQWSNSIVEKDVEMVEDHLFVKLENVHGDAHIKNLKKVKKKGKEELISGKPLWYSKMK